MFEKNNDFEKWWSEHDYSEFHKYDCLDAFNAGEQNGYKKLRNCMNCKYRDAKEHSSCKDKGIVLCSHWEVKE